MDNHKKKMHISRIFKMVLFYTIIFFLSSTSLSAQNIQAQELRYGDIIAQGVALDIGAYQISDKQLHFLAEYWSRPNFLGDYLFYYNDYLEKIAIFQRNGMSLVIDDEYQDYPIFPILSYDNNIVAILERNLNQEAVLFSVEAGNRLVAKGRIDDSALFVRQDDYRPREPRTGAISKLPWSRFSYNVFNYGYRKNILFYCDPSYAYIFKIEGTKVILLKEASSFMDMVVPELGTTPIAFRYDKILYLHTFSDGRNIILGDPGPIGYYGLAYNLCSFTDAKGQHYIYNTIRNKLYYDDENLYVQFFDEGCFYHDNIGKSTLAFSSDWHIFLESNSENFGTEVLTLKDFFHIERIQKEENRLYISGLNVGFVYDLLGKEVVEVYRANGDNKIVNVDRFGEKTYIGVAPLDLR